MATMLHRFLVSCARHLKDATGGAGMFQYSSTAKSSSGNNLDELLNDIRLPDDYTKQDDFKIAPIADETQSTTPVTIPGLKIRGILIPTLDTHESVVAGQKYSQLPVAHVSATYNNTIITITDHTGVKTLSRFSAGACGFKNAKKRTTVAAQAAGAAAGQLAMKKGVTHLRVAIGGMGKGRLAACKGLEASGLDLVSLSDVSKSNWGSQKPRKRRRL